MFKRDLREKTTICRIKRWRKRQKEKNTIVFYFSLNSLVQVYRRLIKKTRLNWILAKEMLLAIEMQVEKYPIQATI